MANQNVTDWIDGDVKPALPGVYQKLYCQDIVYAHWNGEFWGMFTGSKSKPEDALDDAHCRSFAQRAKWRGLAENPNKERRPMADQNQGASIEAERLIDAVRKLVKAKGRFHTEQNYKALVDSLDAYDAAVKAPPTAAAGAHNCGNKGCTGCFSVDEVAAAVGAGGLPPLPKCVAYGIIGLTGIDPNDGHRKLSGVSVGKPGAWCKNSLAELFTAEQYREGQRAAIAADRAQRKQATLQEIIDIGQEIEAGAAAPSDETEIAAELLAVAAREKRCADLTSLLRRAASEANRFYRGMMNWKRTAEEKDNIIADLRAQLAQTERAYNIVIEQCRDLVNAQLAAKGQGEPVAIIGSGYAILWLGGEPIAHIVERHGIKVGDVLYTAAPTAGAATTELEKEVSIMYQMLDDGEWAEHVAKTCLGQQLETAITRAIGRVKSGAATTSEDARELPCNYVDDGDRMESFQSCTVCGDIRYNKSGTKCAAAAAQLEKAHAAMRATQQEGGK